MGELEPIEIILKALRFLNWVEIGALNVFHKRSFHHLPVIKINDMHRNFAKARFDSGTQAPFTSNEFIPVASGPYHQWLQHPMGLDGVLELFQLFRVEMLAWLIGILIDHSNCHAAT